ncbi:MAG: SpoIIE family protein phosphatase [Pseudanabaenaceae cyanobacterium]
MSLWAIALVPLLVLGWVSEREVTQRLQTEIQARLEEVAASRVRELETHFRNLQTAVGAIAQSPTIRDLLTSPAPDRRDLQRLLSVYTESIPYQDAFLLSPQGHVRLSLGPQPYQFAGENPHLQQAFAQATTLLKTVISDFDCDRQTGEGLLFVSAPVLGPQGVAGAVVLRLSNRTLARLASQYGGLGRTGEVLVAANLEGMLTLVTPTRHDPAAAFQRRFDPNRQTPLVQTLQMAIAGATGIGPIQDYRGVMTLAAWRYLPSLHGAAVVKIDVDEVWAPIVQMRGVLLGLGGVTAIAVVVAATALAKTLTQPTIELTAAALALATGNYHPWLPTDRRDEIGDLAKAFNEMVVQIQEAMAQLEARVAARTRDLQGARDEIAALNVALQQENLRLSAEVAVGRRLQQLLIPKPAELATMADLEVAGVVAVADEVGGDYFDVLRHGDRVLISIGDVTGHGFESGAISLMVQSALRVLSTLDLPLNQVLALLNAGIYENLQRMDCDKSLTLLLLAYENGCCHLVGQHEEAVVIRQDGTVQRLDTLDLGFPLGLESDITPYLSAPLHCCLAPGDLVVLYTDGIPEATDETGTLYGVEQLCAVAQTHRHLTATAIVETVLASVRSHIGLGRVQDDITLLVLKRRSLA